MTPKTRKLIGGCVVLCLLIAGLTAIVGASEGGKTKILEVIKEPNTTETAVMLRIHVISASNGTPVPGASVSGKQIDNWNNETIINDTGYFQGETDGNGFFVANIVPGTYYIYVSAQNYFSKGATVTLRDGNASLDVEIALEPLPEPDAVLKGRVLNQSDGSPVANATVYAWFELVNCTDYFTSEKVAVTGANGSYELQVYSGILVLSAYAEGYIGYSTTVNVPPNTTMQIDIALIPYTQPEIVSRVEGKVISGGVPVPNARLEFVYRMEYWGGLNGCFNYSEGAWSYSATSDANGNYALEVPAGWLSLTVFAEGYFPYYDEIYVEAHAVLSLNISLEPLPQPDAWITGTVFSEAGLPVSSAYVSAYAIPPNENLSYYTASAQTDENGKFTLPLPAGKYMLSAYHENYGGYSAMVEVETGTTLNIEITLSPITNCTYFPGNDTEARYVVSPPKNISIAPKFLGQQEISLMPGSEYRLNITSIFATQGKKFVFGVRETKYISAIYNATAGELVLKAPENWVGEETVKIEATDGVTTVLGTIIVKVVNQSPPVLWFTCGILVAAGVIALVYYYQRNGKKNKP